MVSEFEIVDAMKILFFEANTDEATNVPAQTRSLTCRLVFIGKLAFRDTDEHNSGNR